MKKPAPVYRVEILTANKEGLKAFLLDLKREQVRHQQPISMYERQVKRRLTPEQYEKIVNDVVKNWEASQAKVVEKSRAKEEAETDSITRLARLQAKCTADHLASTFHSIRFYLGTLNRDINESRVAAYRADMDGGRWWFTPDPIVVTDDGYIINGQHRLLAVERALTEKDEPKSAPQFVVVWGVDKKAALLMDEARRSSTDRRDIALRFARQA